MATKVEGTMCIVRLRGNENENMEIEVFDMQINVLIAIHIE